MYIYYIYILHYKWSTCSTCSTCNLGSNKEHYILCLCGNKYYYKFLYKAKIMKINWSNKSPSIYDIQIFRSQHCIFKCK